MMLVTMPTARPLGLIFFSCFVLLLFFFDFSNGYDYDDFEHRNTLFPLAAVCSSNQTQIAIPNCATQKGYQLIGTTEIECGLMDGETCLAYVAVNRQSQQIVASFRGSSSCQQLTDEEFHYRQVLLSDSVPGAKILAHFYVVTEQIYMSNFTSILLSTASQYPNFDITFLGHSLGSVQAQLIACRLVEENLINPSRVRYYGYGSPRVGNELYVNDITCKLGRTFRITNFKDYIVHIPPQSAGYAHASEEIYYQYSDNMSSPFGYRRCAAPLFLGPVCLQIEEELCSDMWEPNHTDPRYHLTYYNTQLGSAACGLSPDYTQLDCRNNQPTTCPEGWTPTGYANRCYGVLNTTGNYREARQECAKQFALVATTQNGFEASQLLKLIPTTKEVYVGLQKIGAHFFWQDNSSYAEWETGQPVDGYQCAKMSWTSQRLLSTTCTANLTIACVVYLAV